MTSEEPMSAERFRECLERWSRKNVWFVSGRFNRKPEPKSIAAQHATESSTLKETAHALTTTERLPAGFVKRSLGQRRPNPEQSFAATSVERFITATRPKRNKPSWRLRPKNKWKSKRSGMTLLSSPVSFRLIRCSQKRFWTSFKKEDSSRSSSTQFGPQAQSLQNMKRIF